MDIHHFGGEEFKLGCEVPPDGYEFTTATAGSVPGFRIWTKQEIDEALRTKEKGWLKNKFAGKEWVINQGQVGSCAAAAAKGALRRTMYLNGVDAIPDLNHEFTYAQTNRGQDGGAILEEVARSIKEVGMPKADWVKHPPNKHIFLNHYGPEDYRDAHLHRASTVFMAETEEELLTLLLSGQGAAVVAVHVGNNFNSLDKNGFVGAQTYGAGNHAVVICDVDLIDGKPAYHTVNSWGLGWGMDGHAMLDWGRHLSNTIKYHKFYGVLSVNTESQKEETKLV